MRRSPPANPRTPRLPRLPITPEILALLFSSWSQASQKDSYNATMLWAACCTAFFGFSELASSHAHHCKPLNNLCLGHRMSQWILMRTLVLSQSICSVPRLTHSAWELGSTLREQDRLCVLLTHLAWELGSTLREQDRLCVLCLHFWVTWSAVGNNLVICFFFRMDPLCQSRGY